MNHNLGDGSWTLTVFVTDLQVERSLRVRGDLHIGGVMIRLVDELGKKSKIKTLFDQAQCLKITKNVAFRFSKPRKNGPVWHF